YTHPMMGDGHLNKCKECCKVQAAERYRRKSEDPEWVAAERARGRDKYYRLYAPDVPLVFVSPAAPPEVKRLARQRLSNAVRDGKVLKPKQCQECGAMGRLHGHHADYYRPLEVEWLCARCHHRRHRMPVARRPERRAA